MMHLKFWRCQQIFCCFSVKNMGCKPTLCLLFCEVEYGTGISNNWLLLCVQFWCCLIKIALVVRPPPSEITTWRVSAYWLDCQYFFSALCWPIKQHSISNHQLQLKWWTTTGSLIGLMNQNISEMSWRVPLFCTLWIQSWRHIDTC